MQVMVKGEPAALATGDAYQLKGSNSIHVIAEIRRNYTNKLEQVWIKIITVNIRLQGLWCVLCSVACMCQLLVMICFLVVKAQGTRPAVKCLTWTSHVPC